MVIGFHSAGSTNVYNISFPLTGGTGSNDIAFTSSSNYVASGFPSSLTSTQQSAVLLNKICFELY